MASKMIVSLTTKEQLEQVQHLETEVWGIPPIPTHQTLTTIKNGGIMVGMFKDEELIGFSYGFPGFKNGEIFFIHSSTSQGVIISSIEETYWNKRFVKATRVL